MAARLISITLGEYCQIYLRVSVSDKNGAKQQTLDEKSTRLSAPISSLTRAWKASRPLSDKYVAK